MTCTLENSISLDFFLSWNLLAIKKFYNHHIIYMTADQKHLDPMKYLWFFLLNFSLLLLNYFIYVILNELLLLQFEIDCGRIKLGYVVWLVISCKIISNDRTNYNRCILFIILPGEFRFNTFNFSFFLYFNFLP